MDTHAAKDAAAAVIAERLPELVALSHAVHSTPELCFNETWSSHAVAEALVGGQWCVVDATLLAPRASLIRIATGRDAADTAFMSSYGGAVDLIETEVTATIDGALPSDDVNALVSIRS